MEDEERTSKRYVLYIILVLILGLSLPFLLLFLVDPLMWFLIITSFVAGINIPEIILYVRSAKSYRGKKEERTFGEGTA
jgi:predicted membrane channel-forming protein YqfA (hemolysin III family)